MKDASLNVLAFIPLAADVLQFLFFIFFTENGAGDKKKICLYSQWQQQQKKKCNPYTSLSGYMGIFVKMNIHSDFALSLCFGECQSCYT